ncbi:MAG TPA: ABC transporter ATP-binding protein [Stellaceae bacterium]|nr:ABC transporter ATP-binding protein [Stellaceae bacterium]
MSALFQTNVATLFARRPRPAPALDGVLRLDGVSRIYPGAVPKLALDNVSLEIRPGEFVALTGPSGCGKSTLLNILGLLDSPTEGRFRFFGAEAAGLREKELTRLRRERIGFVFQSFNLIDELTVAENVETPLIYRGVPAAERVVQVGTMLERLGLAGLARHRPAQLSGGQQQRVAIARALVGRPTLVLADEPTGNLDQDAGAQVMAVLAELAATGITVVMATHSPAHAARADRVVALLDGRIDGRR